MLETERLKLIPHHPAHLLAMREGKADYERASGMRLADGVWDFATSGEVSPAYWARLAAATGPDVWGLGFAIMHKTEEVVMGMCGYKGPPEDDGVVEIAYGVAPAFQGNGYATEAARALVGYAAKSGRVRVVRAHTLPQANASTRVLTKCGFTKVGEVVDPEDGLVWRWEMPLAHRGG